MSRGGLDGAQQRGGDGGPAPRSSTSGGLASFLVYLPSIGGWRRTTRGQVGLARARARADASLLTAFAVLVVLAAGLATAIPRQLTRTVDGGARQAVAAGGPAAAVDVQFVARYVTVDSFGGVPAGLGDGTTTEKIRQSAADTVKSTPEELGSILGPMTVSALSQPLEVSELRDPGARAPRQEVRLLARVGWADPLSGGRLTWVQGQPPTVGATTALHRPVIPVGVSQEAAEAWHLAPGARLTGSQAGSGRSTLVVTGVYRVDDPAAGVWQSLDSAQAPVPRDPKRVGASIDEVTFLVDGDALTLVEAGLGDNGLWVHLRRPVDVPSVTGERLRAVRSLLHSYADDELSPMPSDPSADFVSTLPGIVDTYTVRARAVISELSLVVVAVIGVGAVVLLLAAQLLTRRRRSGLALQHARGASLTAIGAGLLLESLVVAGTCLVIGGGLGMLLTPHAGGGPGVWLLVAAIALGLNPVLGMLAARAAWATRKTPANRRARARQSAEVGLRRVVLEVIVLAVAAAAVVSLRTRGLSAATGVDPLLAAAPLLLTAGLTVVLLRLYPWPVRLAAALARRRPTALPVVAAARAKQALSWSPLLAMVLAVGLMVGTGLIRTTLIEGQEDASWQRIGADVRADLNKAVPGETTVQALAASPGVTAACTGTLADARTTIGASDATLTAMLVDSTCYRKVLQASGLSGAEELAGLDAPLPDGSVRAVLAGDVDWPDASVDLSVKGETPLKVTGVAHASQPPSGWREGAVVILDRKAAGAAGLTLPEPTTLWVVGPGAAAAVAAQPESPGWDVHDRQAWLSERSSGGVIADMGRLLVVALVLLALLATIAMIQTTTSGAAERARAVSLLRTLGLPLREGNRLTMTELLPLVVVGVAAGAGAGFGLVELLGPSLGLEQVTGGVGRPTLRMSPTWAAAVLAAALVLVLVAAVVESVLQRRQRLASVLRVGETR